MTPTVESHTWRMVALVYGPSFREAAYLNYYEIRSTPYSTECMACPAAVFSTFSRAVYLQARVQQSVWTTGVA